LLLLQTLTAVTHITTVLSPIFYDKFQSNLDSHNRIQTITSDII